MKKYNIAIVGRGNGSSKFLEVLEERRLPALNYYCLHQLDLWKACKVYGKRTYYIELTEACFDDKEIDIALFSEAQVSAEGASFASKVLSSSITAVPENG